MSYFLWCQTSCAPKIGMAQSDRLEGGTQCYSSLVFSIHSAPASWIAF